MNDPYTPMQSDAQLEAFLATISLEQALCDLAPHTDIEIRMVGRHRDAA